MPAFKGNRNSRAVVRIFLLFVFAAMIRYVWTAFTAFPYAFSLAKSMGDKLDNALLGQMMSTDIKFFLLTSLYNLIIAILVLTFWIRLDHRSLDDIGLKWSPNRLPIMGIGAVLAVIIFGSSVTITNMLGYIWPVTMGTVTFGTAAVMKTSLYAILIVLVTILGEELLYRGYIQNSAMSFAHPTTAVYISALIFMMSRFGVFKNTLGMLEVFLIGLILGYLYLLTGSLYITLGFRFVWDYLKIYIFRFQTDYGFQGPVWQVYGNDGIVMMRNLTAGTRLQLIFIIVEVLVAVGLFFLCRKQGLLLHKNIEAIKN